MGENITWPWWKEEAGVMLIEAAADEELAWTRDRGAVRLPPVVRNGVEWRAQEPVRGKHPR